MSGSDKYRRMPAGRTGTGPPRIVILMAVYQGARFLQAQLDSIALQTYRHWSLIASDDGSTDGSREILAGFSANYPGRVTLIEGPKGGATQNFLHLLQQAPEGHYISFCDQDDWWLPDKLSRAVAMLQSVQGPGHYAARTLICDEDLHPLTGSRYFARPFGFRNALIQACMAGNTSIFNEPAARILRAGAGAAAEAGVTAHDWWAYQLMSGSAAQIIRDDSPALLYRQHEQSEMGRNDTARALIRRLGLLADGNFGCWLSANHQALTAAPSLTDENRRILQEFGAALHLPGPRAARVFRRLGLYRHTVPGTAAFYAAAAAGRLRQSGGSSPDR